MGVRLKSLIGLGVLAAVTMVTQAAQAQERPATFKPRETIPAAIDRAFDAPMSEYRNPQHSLESLIGVIGYPENSIARDAEHIHRIYLDVFEQQASSDPLLRTTDLPNPYNTSVLTLPTANLGSRVVGSELVFEPLR
ncbi:MAG: hypothetical protein HC936_12160 [Leptolyngbyaceae cyanobacterium SU_3_3]|nr:hypothetical protein [Leptolyngbyaceae cyanobacterium SU_3_3]NJR51959.1 hypothetical protein [Leptolyngbyaceae cyanobacterium CSU_1_3]